MGTDMHHSPELAKEVKSKSGTDSQPRSVQTLMVDRSVQRSAMTGPLLKPLISMHLLRSWTSLAAIATCINPSSNGAVQTWPSVGPASHLPRPRLDHLLDHSWTT